MTEFDIEKETYKSSCVLAPMYLQEDKHWGCDLDIIKGKLNRKENINILDAGCGSGWHLVNLRYIVPGTLQLVGIDYSKEMLTVAKEFIRRNGMQGIIALKERNLLSTVFGADSFDTIICLNNTLGNIPSSDLIHSADKRHQVLREFNHILKKNGILILSVYNAETLDLNDYGGIFKIESEISISDSSDVVLSFSLPKEDKHYYYSHWFTEDEIIQLLQDNKFTVNDLELRRERIIATSSKE